MESLNRNGWQIWRVVDRSTASDVFYPWEVVKDGKVQRGWTTDREGGGSIAQAQVDTIWQEAWTPAPQLWAAFKAGFEAAGVSPLTDADVREKFNAFMGTVR